MAGNISNSAKNLFNEIGAIQTLVENFPMSLISFGDLKFATSFDVLSILFKILGVDREKLIELLTNVLCGSIKEDSDGTGFISQVEEIVKIALEANLSNILNCSTNPIISNDLLDYYVGIGEDITRSGNGITIDVSEIDMMGILNKNPFSNNDSKFYFDTDDYKANDVWKSKDFNAFLWYIINKSDKSQDEETIWDDRYRASLYGNKKNNKKKEIIRCTYIDDNYPNSDKIKVQICGARNNDPANYFKTGFLKKIGDKEWALNKTIFQFNHDFLSSIKLYEPKVIIAEMVEYLLGTGNLTINLGFSINEQIIQGKIQNIIKDVIESSDTELNDCYFSFSNEDYNDMLETSERNRFNIVNNGDSFFEVNPDTILDPLSNINTKSEKIDDTSVISKTLYDITAIPASDPESVYTLDVDYDWSFELIRIIVYPFIRPLFTPKVMFLLAVNRKIMGEITHTSFEELFKSLFIIIKDIIVKIKDLIVDMFLNFILEELSSLLALFASKLLLETLNNYRSLLNEILEKCSLGWNYTIGNIDNVNYADIDEIEQIEPEQTIC